MEMRREQVLFYQSCPLPWGGLGCPFPPISSQTFKNAEFCGLFVFWCFIVCRLRRVLGRLLLRAGRVLRRPPTLRLIIITRTIRARPAKLNSRQPMSAKPLTTSPAGKPARAKPDRGRKQPARQLQVKAFFERGLGGFTQINWIKNRFHLSNPRRCDFMLSISLRSLPW